MNIQHLTAKVGELVNDKQNGLNPNERARFTDGDMKVNSMIRILEEHTPYVAIVLPIHKKHVDKFLEDYEYRTAG